MSKVLFLDIDGCLLPIGAIGDTDVTEVFKAPWAHLDLLVEKTSKEAVEAVAYMCAGQPLVVIISTWRRFFPKEFVKVYLERIGLTDALHGDWFATMRLSSSKAHDIHMWLEDHPGTKQWVAIDDFPLGLQGSRQITPADPRAGLTHADLKRTLREWQLDDLFRQASLESDTDNAG